MPRTYFTHSRTPREPSEPSPSPARSDQHRRLVGLSLLTARVISCTLQAGSPTNISRPAQRQTKSPGRATLVYQPGH